MKKFIVLALCLLGPTIYAQNDDLGQIKLAVVTPDFLLEDLTLSHVSKIRTKIQSMVSNYGMSGTDYINDFVIYPKFEIYEQEIIPGTYGDIHSMEAELTLLVVDAKTKSLLAAAFPLKLKGESRRSRDDAITKSIGRIKTRGQDIEKFMGDIKQKIMEYYQSNCNRIYNEANAMLNNGLVEAAINLLLTVPNSLSGDCYAKIQSKLVEAYVVYSNLKCKTLIREAKAAINKSELNYARGLLEQISKNSSCYSEAQSLMKGMDTKKNSENPEGKNKDAEVKLEKRKETVLKKAQREVAQKDDKEQLCDLGIGVDCN